MERVRSESIEGATGGGMVTTNIPCTVMHG